MAKFKIPFNVQNPAHPDYNQTLDVLLLMATKAGTEANAEVGSVVSHVDTDLAEANGVDIVGAAKLVLSVGGNVEDYPVFIKCVQTDLVPVGIPFSEKFDENGDSLGQKTWTEWKRDDHDFFTLTDGNDYLASSAGTGIALAFSELAPVLENDIIGLAEFKSLQPEPIE